MKVSPSHQTLILANERAASGGPMASASLGAVRSRNALLQRVTILTAQPDSTVVYVRADYAVGAEPAWEPPSPARTMSGGAEPVIDVEASPTPGHGNLAVYEPRTPRPEAVASGRGAALYASTQRFDWDAPTAPRLSVHA